MRSRALTSRALSSTKPVSMVCHQMSTGILLRRPPNKEALRLYRDILRTCKRFTFPNEQGEPWGVVLARSARAEFEQARHETDPEMIARMLVVGTDSVMQIQHRFEVAQAALSQKAEAALRGQSSPHSQSQSHSGSGRDTGGSTSRLIVDEDDRRRSGSSSSSNRRSSDSSGSPAAVVVEADSSPYALDQRAPEQSSNASGSSKAER